jgi:hypothetical protein
MKPTKGYYSLIQYCPDATLSEAANVGVLVFCPERGFLKAATIGNNRRIIRFFGSEGHDWEQINTLKKGLEDRLTAEASEIRTPEDLRQFIATRANLFQITPPRPMKVFDPQEDLEALYQQVFGVSVKREAKTSFKKYLGSRLIRPGLESLIAQDLKVEVPALGKSIDIPYGYQNGRFNLITPVRFEAARPEQSAINACKYAVEGKSLYDHPDARYGELQLVIVGKFRSRDEETPKRVRRVLEDFGVRLFPVDKLHRLVDEIRKTGKVLKLSESP